MFSIVPNFSNRIQVLWVLFAISGLFIFSSCVFREATPTGKQEVFLFTDKLTATDSTIITEFEKIRKCDVKIVILSGDDYLAKVKTNQYNTGADVLWFSNDSVQNDLYQRNAIENIESTDWDKLEGEFNTKHNKWFPICHDPLVLTTPKDSTACDNINFNTWHSKDSASPQFVYPYILPKYKYLIEKTAIKKIMLPDKQRKVSNEYIWNLSALAHRYTTVDTTFNKNKYFCKQLISVNKKHVTRTSCLYLAKYGRNLKNGNNLINWLVSRHKLIASSRNELSCFENVMPNYTIQQLALLF